MDVFALGVQDAPDLALLVEARQLEVEGGEGIILGQHVDLASLLDRSAELDTLG